MNLPKIYIGPMTQNVIDAVIEFSNETNIPLGFILSRRQIDYSGGYVGYKTGEFLQYVRKKTENVIVCRDHSGPWQGQELDWSMLSDIRSLYTDSLNCMDIIHIDPWKKCKSYEDGLRETLYNIFYVHAVNPDVLFEVGTEEAIRRFETKEFETFLIDLKYNLGDIFTNNVQYAVIQSGTKLVGTKNTGEFNLTRLQDMVNICNKYEVSSKEHNGDYLSNRDIKIRFVSGLDAINIAPEFGVIETKIILEQCNESAFNEIYDICLAGEKWKKWVDNSFDPLKEKRQLIEICGHYHNKELKQIVGVSDELIKAKLKKSLNNLFNL